MPKTSIIFINHLKKQKLIIIKAKVPENCFVAFLRMGKNLLIAAKKKYGKFH
jgi:hypothetical protein